MGRIGKFLLVISGLLLLATGASAQVSQQPLPGVDLKNTWTQPNNFTTNVFMGGPNPWSDVVIYGANARNLSSIPSAIASTNGTTAVTLNSSPGAIDLQNGEGIVIWAAGNAPTMSTPIAPTFGQQSVSGSSTYNWQCVGVDGKGGLTAASPIGTITNGPAIFGNLPVTISSISRSSNVVTVTFSANINASTSANTQHIAIINVTGAATSFNGNWLIASAPAANQITFAQSGPNESGTVSSTSTGRLTNAANISAISRSGTTITITTDAPHNFVIGTGQVKTIVIVTGVTPVDLNGEYVLGTGTTGSTIVLLNTGINATATETGTVTLGSSVATVYEYEEVQCPVISIGSQTVKYIVYGDYGTGTFKPVGQTLYDQRTMKDWGQWLMKGFQVPGYVPSTPPVSAQNQMYTGTIVSGAGANGNPGTLNLVVNPAVPSTVSNATLLHDDGQAVAAALNANGMAFISVPIVINAPLSVPGNQNLLVNAPIKVNETINLVGTNRMEAAFLPPGTSPSMSFTNYIQISGSANPVVAGGNLEAIRGFSFADSFNGQNLVLFGNEIGKPNAGDSCIYNSVLKANNVVSVPIVYQGAGPETCFNDSSIVALSTPLPIIGITGQIPYPPMIPGLWLKGDDLGNQADMPGGFMMLGRNSINNRGVFLDYEWVNNSDTSRYLFDFYEDQNPNTPPVAVAGSNVGSQIYVRHVIGDSTAMPIYANWVSNGGYNVTLDEISSSFGMSLITGFAINGLVLKGVIPSSGLGQNFGYIALLPSSSGRMNFSSGVNSTVGLLTNAQPFIQATGNTPFSYPFAVQYPQPVVTSVTQGSGSITNTNVGVTVTAVGWNGAESQPSNFFPISPNPSSSSITVNWNSIPGVQGYNVYYGTTASAKQNASLITTNSFTFSTVGNSGQAPFQDATGNPLIDSNQVATPLVRFTDGAVHKGDLAALQPLTANRTWTLPDANGQVCVAGLCVLTSAPVCPFSTKSANYTLTPADCIINVSSAATITIPHATTGIDWTVSNTTASSTVTLQSDSGTINGAANVILTGNSTAIIHSDGTNVEAMLAGGGGGSGTVGNCSTNGALGIYSVAGTTITCDPNLVDNTTYILASLDFSIRSNALDEEATTAAGTYNVGNLACVTATNTVGDCGSAAANRSYIGVLRAKNGTTPEYAKDGQVAVNSNSSVTWTAGDVVCTDASNAAKAIDNGANPCQSPSIKIGIVKTTDGSNTTSHTITLTRADAMPMIQQNGSALADETTVNFINDTADAGGVTFTNPANGQLKAVLSNTAGGGTSTLACTLSSIAQGQVVGFNSTPTCQNLYPGVNLDAQTGSYTIACPTDRLGNIEFNISSASTATLPQAGNNACFQSSIAFVIANSKNSTALLTVTATTSTFQPENVSSLFLKPGDSVFIYSDAVSSTGNYHTVFIGRMVGGTVTKTAGYTMTELDGDRLIIMNCSSACVLTFPATPPSTTPASFWMTHVVSIGSSVPTTALSGTNFNGSSTPPTLATGFVSHFFTDGTNYFGDAVPSGSSGTVASCGTTNAVARYTAATTTGCDSGLVESNGGLFSKYDGLTTDGTGVPVILKVSDVTAQSTSQGTVTLLSSAPAGSYILSYYANQNAVCTTGSNQVVFTFNWTDAGNARTVDTGQMTLGSAQNSATGFLSGILPLFVNSGSITYTSTVTGTCTTGTSSYDIHVVLERKK